MKKIICIILTITFMLSFAACEMGNNYGAKDDHSSDNLSSSSDKNHSDSTNDVDLTQPSTNIEQTQPSSEPDEIDFLKYDFTGEWGSPYNDEQYLKLIDGSLTLSFGGMPYYGEYTKDGCADNQIKLIYGTGYEIVTLSYENGIVFLRWPADQVWDDDNKVYVSLASYYFVRPDDFEKVKALDDVTDDISNPFEENDIDILGEWVHYKECDSQIVCFYTDGTFVCSVDGVVRSGGKYTQNKNTIEFTDVYIYTSDDFSEKEIIYIDEPEPWYVFNYRGFYEIHSQSTWNDLLVRSKDVTAANRDPNYDISIIGEWGNPLTDSKNIVFYEDFKCKYTSYGVIDYGTYEIDGRVITIHHGNEATQVFLEEDTSLDDIFLLRFPGEEVWDDALGIFLYTAGETIYRVEDFDLLRFIDSLN